MSTDLILAASTSVIPSIPYVAISVMAIDRSGSMAQFGRKPLEQANRFLDELAKDPNADVTAVGIVTFANDYSLDLPFTMVKAAPRLQAYRAEGNTLLYQTIYDCLGSLVLLADQRSRMGLKTDVIFTVLTDGEDTHSPPMLDNLRALSAEGLRRGWQLRIFGFGVDGSEIARKVGFVDARQAASATPDVKTSGGYTVDPDDEEGFERSVLFAFEAVSQTTRLR